MTKPLFIYIIFQIKSVSFSLEFIKDNKEFDALFGVEVSFEFKLLKSLIAVEIYFRIFMILYFRCYTFLF